jgi:hypothetical protein
MRSRLGLEGLDPVQQLEKLCQRISELGRASQEALLLLALGGGCPGSRDQVGLLRWPGSRALDPQRFSQ